MDDASTAFSSNLFILESLTNHPASIRAASLCPTSREAFEWLRSALGEASITSSTELSTSSSLITPPGSIPAASPSPTLNRSFEQAGQVLVARYTKSQSLMKLSPQSVGDGQNIAGKRPQRTRSLSSESEIDLNNLGLERQDPPMEVQARYSRALLAIRALRDKIDNLGANFAKLVIGNDFAEEDVLADTMLVYKKMEPSGDRYELSDPDPFNFHGIGAQFESPPIPQESTAPSSGNLWYLSIEDETT